MSSNANPSPTNRFARSTYDTLEPLPPICVHYFYSSPLDIDELLAPVRSPTATPVVLPFSDYDSNALDVAWRKLRRNVAAAVENEQSRDRASVSSLKAIRSPTACRTPETFGNVTAHDGPVRHSPESTAGRFTSTHKRESSSGEPRRAAKTPDRINANERQESDVSGIYDCDDRQDTQSHLQLNPDSHGLTGMPFIRAPARSSMTNSMREESHATDHDEGQHTRNQNEEPELEELSVTVGAARIHQVLIPKLSMEPIYWNPVHDIIPVVRGTWFYTDTMLPVEPDVANLLEKGYLELRPWTQTWNDELNSAVEVGALGEEKIAHKLWPTTNYENETGTARPDSAISSAIGPEEESHEQKRKRILDATAIILDSASTGPSIDNKAVGSITVAEGGQKTLYLESSVIYSNERNAVILRPHLAPSSYYGRKPFANYIRKGFKIGVRVSRGFDRAAFDRIHTPRGRKTASIPQKSLLPTWQNENTPNRTSGLKKSTNTETPSVTDLVLVIHGIGQKLSERVESFHFTHAMNAFRREVNIALCEPTIRAHSRSDMGDIMVLPVNWRSTLSFEEDSYCERDRDATYNKFSLSDITPESLPSVRNIVSDVMLDIPYYLSHYQPKIISAVVREANRIYRLWCQRNPGFQKTGRVHLIAHSLGSVIALDILSNQPSFVGSDVADIDTEAEHFAFDTKNLFLCGSPAGFFLLLKKVGLTPRRDRKVPSSGGEALASAVAGNQHTYGCLSVDNIYNIVNPYDPVAYLLNATIDVAYALSLTAAYVPSSSRSWLSFGRSFRGDMYVPGAPKGRGAQAHRLPSSVELETHNFTREEIAETRAYWLNDNGQIDYFLRYGGGPLEIQYLTMLGAHSSYWVSQDFIRFVVLETCRRPGRESTLEFMRAAKKPSTK